MKAHSIAKDMLDSLSPLEADIIKAIAPYRKYRSKDIYALVKNKASKSSVSVILDRLYKKGLVSREVETARGGIRFIYTLKQSKERFEKSIIDNTVNALIKKFGSRAIVYFNESLKKKGEK